MEAVEGWTPPPDLDFQCAQCGAEATCHESIPIDPLPGNGEVALFFCDSHHWPAEELTRGRTKAPGAVHGPAV